MSEAFQKSQQKDVTTDVELVKQQRREKEEQTKTKKAAKLGTEAGQDPENKNLYDIVSDVQQFLKNDARLKTNKAQRVKQAQKAQNQQLEETINQVSENPGGYLIEDSETGETRPLTGRDIDRMKSDLEAGKENLDKIDRAIEQGKENVEIYGENIRVLNATAINPPTPRRQPQRTSPPVSILDVGPQGESQLPTSRGNQYIDALGPVEQQIGQEAIEYIDRVNPPTREPELRKRGAEQFEAYESRFDITTEIRLAGTELGISAREPLEVGEPANLLQVVAGAGLTFTASAADALSAPIRPGLAAKALESVSTAEKRVKIVESIAADPTGSLFGAIGGYSGSLILANLVPPKVETVSEYKFPSELDDEVFYGRPVFQSGKPTPKGVKYYTDYSGELRRYMPASARWEKLVQGGDQFINDAIYTNLVDSRPTGANIPRGLPYQQFSQVPGVSPVKISSTTVTPGISPTVALGGLLIPGDSSISESIDKSVKQPKNNLTEKPFTDVSIKPVPGELPDVKTVPIQLPMVSPIEAQTVETVQQETVPLTMVEPLVTPPTPPTPTLPDIYEPNDPEPFKIDTEPRRKKKRVKKKKGALGVFELRIDTAFDVDFKEPKIKEFKL